MATGGSIACLGAATSNVAWIDDAAEQAVRLARCAPGGTSRVCIVQPAELPASPDALLPTAAFPRTVLAEDDGWLLAEGRVDTAEADGPGRFAALARHQAIAAALTVTAAPRGGPSPRWLLAATFDERSSPAGEWAGQPAARCWLPARLRLRTASGGWELRCAVVRAQDDPGVIAASLVRPVQPGVPAPSMPWSPVADDYVERVEDAVDLIRDMALKKVVLARAADLSATLPADAILAERLLAAAGWAYWQDLDDGGALAGSTPELLFAGNGHDLHTMALAGTCTAGDAGRLQAMLDSTKERKEHGLVVEHIVAALRPRSAPLELPAQPHARTVGGLVHLETRIAAVLNRPDWFDLLAALHPTPAVCGLPAPTAAHYLRRRERLARGLYAGVLGWIADDACRCIVPLRGAVLAADRSRARLYAGAGIIETSIGQAEWDETELKLSVMRHHLR